MNVEGTLLLLKLIEDNLKSTKEVLAQLELQWGSRPECWRPFIDLSDSLKEMDKVLKDNILKKIKEEFKNG
jgi:hypothetical protein